MNKTTGLAHGLMAALVLSPLAVAPAAAVPINGPTALTVFTSAGPGALIDLDLSATGSIYIDFSGAGLSSLLVESITAGGDVVIDEANGSSIAFPHLGVGTEFTTDSGLIEVIGDVLLTPVSGIGGTWSGAPLNLTAGGGVFLYNLGVGSSVNLGGINTSGGTVGTGGSGGGVTIGGGGIVIGGGTLSLPTPGSLPLQALGLGVLGLLLLARRARMPRPR